LTDIRYDGTMAEWEAIAKDGDWYYCDGEYVVSCSDGKIAKTES
jgi:hypothetical protein